MIPSTPRRAGPLNGNGTATSFPFSFKVYATGDVAVVRANMTTAVETLLTEGVDYSVTLNADQVNTPGGTITYPLSGSPLAAGFSLTIYGDTDYTQTLSLVGVSKFDPAAIEKALDRVVMQTQQLLEQLSRTLTLAVSSGAATNLTLPAPLANNLIGWNAVANGLQNVDASALATLVAYGTAMRDYFTGDGVTKDFTLSANPGALGNIDVDIGGVTQNGQTDFTWAGGTTLSFTTAPPVGLKIQVRYLQALPVGAVGAATVGTTQLIDGGVTTVKLAAGAVTDAKVSDVAFSKLTGLPSTLAGYGITDAHYAGDVKHSWQTADHGRWLLLTTAARTIGSATSGATARANADTLALYTQLWNAMSDADCPVAGGRGASAAADFAANKKIQLPLMGGLTLKGHHGGDGTYTTNTTRALGSYEADQILNHSHSFNYRTLVGSGAGIVNSDGSTGGMTPSQSTIGGGVENLVRNRSANIFIYF